VRGRREVCHRGRRVLAGGRLSRVVQVVHVVQARLLLHELVDAEAAVALVGQVRPLKRGTEVMIFKMFSPKKMAKKSAFLTRNNAKLCKNLIIILVFVKNGNFFDENWQKMTL
jgi:hypothetical protein